jgi:hypothetical protein
MYLQNTLPTTDPVSTLSDVDHLLRRRRNLSAKARRVNKTLVQTVLRPTYGTAGRCWRAGQLHRLTERLLDIEAEIASSAPTLGEATRPNRFADN